MSVVLTATLDFPDFTAGYYYCMLRYVSFFLNIIVVRKKTKYINDINFDIRENRYLELYFEE